MGAAESSDAQDEIEEVDLSHLSGYRVMRTFKGSPAYRAGLAPYEDFIVAVDKIVCDAETNALGNLLKRHENTEVEILIWNCIDERDREVKLRPQKWSGPGLLGAAVKHEQLQNSTNNTWHVIDLTPKSPADEAGLVPDTDYIVGTPATVFKTEDDMSMLVKDAARKREVVTLCVYSTATGRLREVELTPRENWGGKGLLGCELATGWLHRIPPRIDPDAPRTVDREKFRDNLIKSAGQSSKVREASSSASGSKTTTKSPSPSLRPKKSHSRKGSEELVPKRSRERRTSRRVPSEGSSSGIGSDSEDLS